MKKINSFNLIDGKFTLDEASEILLNLYNSKIQFHQMKNFSSNERFGKNDENSLEKIRQLKEELEHIKSVLNSKNASNVLVQINSTINIELDA